MKYIVNLKDLILGNVIEHMIDGKIFVSEELAEAFALECQENYKIINQALLGAPNFPSPDTIQYYVEKLN